MQATMTLEEEAYELLNPSKDQYFLFLSDGHLFGFHALHVVEIVELPSITKVPLLSPFVTGVANIRGDMVGVVDLRMRFGFPKKADDKHTSLAIVKTYQQEAWHQIAIKIDEIYEVDGLDESTFGKAPLFGTSIDARFVKHLAKYNHQEVAILDLDALLKLEELSLTHPPIIDHDARYSKALTQKRVAFHQSDEDDEDEIDIVQLVSTNANDSNQYLVFVGPQGQYYAKNVAKIEEVIAMQELEIAKSFDHSIILGTASVRGQMLTLIGFDAWLGAAKNEEVAYEEVLILNYGGQKFALAVQSSEQIVSITPENMHDNSTANSKSNFITKVALEAQEVLCTIVDSDQLMRDSFVLAQEQNEKQIASLKALANSKKTVLFADDSRFIRSLLENVATKLDLNYVIYNDGKQLLDGLKTLPTEEIGLIVTDIEMPVMDGKTLIGHIRKNSAFDDIAVLVHTNMSSNVLERELEQTGANGIISKIDVASLSKAIVEHIRA